MPIEIVRRTLELPEALNCELFAKFYRQYPDARPSFNAYLVEILSAWVEQPAKK